MYNVERSSRIGTDDDLVASLANVRSCESNHAGHSHRSAARNHPGYMVFAYYFLLVRFGKKYLDELMPSGYNFSRFLSSDRMAKLIGLLVSYQTIRAIYLEK
jgi:hypothetical protein